MNRVKFYLASTLSNAATAEDIAAYLRSRGWIQTFDWTDLAIEEDSVLLGDTARREIDGVMEADILFLLMPARRGSHVELGAALAAGIPVIILSTDEGELRDNGRPVSFYHHGLVAHRIVDMDWFTLACRAHKLGGPAARKYKRTLRRQYVTNTKTY